MEKFLQEMATVTGNGSDLHGSAVLELRFGEVLTLTSLINDPVTPCLGITAILPRRPTPAHGLQQPARSSVQGNFADEAELLWHAEEGRYVLMRKIPLACLPDERSVFDTILETADKAWEMYLSLPQGGCRR